MVEKGRWRGSVRGAMSGTGIQWSGAVGIAVPLLGSESGRVQSALDGSSPDSDLNSSDWIGYPPFSAIYGWLSGQG